MFTSVILPPYLRKSGAVEELVPWLCFKGISRGEFPEALQALLGEGTDGFSPIVVIRVKGRWRQEYEEWSRRDLSKEEFVYVWG